ncbi:MAG: hypothetical protein ACR2JJ_08610 [Sphingomicrobium sp.]
MPKKKPGMTPEQQKEAFRAKVREMIDAGELNPTEADRAMDELVRRAATKPKH